MNRRRKTQQREKGMIKGRRKKAKNEREGRGRQRKSEDGGEGKRGRWMKGEIVTA